MDARKDMWDKLSIISVAFAAIGTITGGLLFFTQQSKVEFTGIEFTTTTSLKATKELEEIVARVDNIEAKLATLTEVPKDIPLAPKIAEIEEDIASLKENMSGINSVIMETPQKVLQIPIIRKDLDSLRNELFSAMKSIEREVSRAYDTMKWVVGTIVFGILSLAAGTFFKGRKE